MHLEQCLEENTKAVRDLTAAINGNKGAAAVPAKGPGRPAAAAAAGAKAPKNTAEDVMKAAVSVKSALSQEAASFLIEKHGKKGDKLKDLKPAAYDAFVAECESSVENGAVEGFGEATDDGEGL